jgi:hypothetical protein
MIRAITDALETLFGGGVLLFGVFAIYVGIKRVWHQVGLFDNSIVVTGSIDEPGMVAINARIEGPVIDALRSPFKRERGVLSKWQLKEFVGHELGSGHHWWDWGEGYKAVPFLVDDGSGPVRVEVSGEEELNGLELDLAGFPGDPVLEVAVSEAPPDHVREFTDEHELRDRPPEADVPTWEDEQGDRRYFEKTLTSGDEVHVIGHAEPVDSDDPNAPVAKITPADDRTFYLTDRRREGAVKHQLKRATVYFFIGGVCLWYGVAQFVPSIGFP